jgi:iron(III) transport system ATP-binding protein
LGDVVLRDVQKRYGHTVACTDINLEIQKGAFFTFLGPSGCGKTTILRLIAGLIMPDRGSIFLDGADITTLEPEKRKVGMVFQNYALFPFMTVLENVEYGLKVQKKAPADRKAKAATYLAMVGLGGFENRNVSELSGGEQQRVALARSLAIEPRVLLLDEPLSNLDARLRDNMRQELKRLQKSLGITTIFVTHDQTEALTMSDRVAVFNQGACIQTGTPEEIYQTPRDSFVARFVGETNLFPVRFADGQHYLPNNQRIDIGGAESCRYISVRPQNLRLSTRSINCDYCFTGIVEERQYNGFSFAYTIQAENLRFCAVTISRGDARALFSVGQKVNVGFCVADIRFLKQ